jgi:alanine-synthesizing transaminase
MRTFSKSKKLSHVAYDVRGPVLDAATAMEAEGVKILKLNIGNPAPFGFRTSDEVLEAVGRGLESSEGYSDSKGMEAVREAVAAYCRGKGIKDVSPGDVYTGNGLSELIVMCMQGLLDSGDEILIPSPDYPLWTAAATLAGGTVRHYVCDEAKDWDPDIEDMRRKVTPRTKAVVVINPNNPTGALYRREVLEQIVDFAREHELIIFADEVYDRLLMDGLSHTSIASLAPDLFVVTLNGLSKSHMIAGFRSAWMCISGDKRKGREYIQGLNMLSSMRLCSNVPAQHAIPVALRSTARTDELLKPGGRIYEQRETVCRALSEIEGIRFVRPKAGFYVFPGIDNARFGIVDDEKFVLDFLRAKHVLLVHGRGFHWEKPDHFRIVFLPDPSVLEEAMTKLKEFLSDYRQS